MLEKPPLQDEKIIAGLRDAYGVPVTGLDFLPIGNDANAWAYRVCAVDGENYFLKVRKGAPAEPALAVPHYLKDQGIAQVIAPLPTLAQELWQRVDEFALILYPFIAGKTGMEAGLSDPQWVELGAILHKIHATKLTPALARLVKKETFSSRWRGVVKTLDPQIQTHEHKNVFEQELAAFWQTKRAEINKLVARTEEFGRLLQKSTREFVLCHADIHTANLLLASENQLLIVDWDETTWAPKERDLMFVSGDVGSGGGGAKEAALFFQGYGQTVVDPLAFAYYRYEWVVQEIGDFGERVFLTQEMGEETKNEAVQAFKALFQPGDVVEVAYGSDQKAFTST